jgi:hypothetical protein
MMIFVQRRLLNFFEAVRKAGDPWEWNFLLITTNDGVWTEAMLQRGLPVSWICLIEAHASCPYQIKCATGFSAAHRTVKPRKAALNIVRESQALVADVRIEFAERRREQQ